MQLAKIQQGRAVILVNNDEQINIETALIVREINLQARLVVRSTKENHNQMLTEYLGNFVSFKLKAGRMPTPQESCNSCGVGRKARPILR